ncbi:Uncharacterised protein [Mycobacteroides abscessus subsp. abscessus]|nr:Uncharacterised protein [Mycobacteroides abscessus subsp. abscessus]
MPNQRRWQAESGGQVVCRVAVDRGLRAGGQIQPDQPGAVGVPAGAEPHSGTIRRHLCRVHSDRIVGAVIHAQRAQRPGLVSREFDITSRCQRLCEHFVIRAAEPGHDPAGIFGEHGQLARCDIELVEVDLVDPAVV